MKKLANRPVLFGLFILLTEPLAASLVVSLVSGLTAGIAGSDSLFVPMAVCLSNILFVLLMTQQIKKLQPDGFCPGCSKAHLGLGCLLLLPQLIEPLLYVIEGYLGAVFTAGLTSRDFLLAFFNGLSPGVTEELVFRGWILGSILCRWKDRRRGIPAALAVSSLLFSMAHLYNILAGQSLIATLNQLAFTLALGCTAGAAYCRSRNILAPILFHCFHDIFSLVILSAVDGTAGGSSANILQLSLYVLLILYSFCLVRPRKQEEIKALWAA